MNYSAPKQFTIGESLKWTKSFSDYPAGDWSLSYSFRGTGKGFDVTATADGTDHLVSVAAIATAECAAGVYFYQAFVSKDDEKILVDSGQCIATASLAALDGSDTFDGRSDVKRTLDAIDARISGDISKGVLEYTIADRQLKRYSMRELSELRTTYARLYSQEQSAARAANGGSLMKMNYVKFNRPR